MRYGVTWKLLFPALALFGAALGFRLGLGSLFLRSRLGFSGGFLGRNGLGLGGGLLRLAFGGRGLLLGGYGLCFRGGFLGHRFGLGLRGRLLGGDRGPRRRGLGLGFGRRFLLRHLLGRGGGGYGKGVAGS